MIFQRANQGNQIVVIFRCRGFARRCCALFTMFIVTLLGTYSVHAQAPSAGGQVSIPDSSVEKPQDGGVRAHTTIQVYRPNPNPNTGGVQVPPGSVGPDPPPPPLETTGTNGGTRPR
jgi:hypothetical protein